MVFIEAASIEDRALKHGERVRVSCKLENIPHKRGVMAYADVAFAMLCDVVLVLSYEGVIIAMLAIPSFATITSNYFVTLKSTPRVVAVVREGIASAFW